MTTLLPSESVTRWLCSAISEALRVPVERVDSQASFRQLGLDSMAASMLASRLSTWLDRKIPVTTLWEFPSIHALAAHLSGEARDLEAVRVVRHAAQEPIAVVGMSGRFPGADSIEAFWQLLREGKDAITDVPWERFGLPPDQTTIPLRQAGFLRDVHGFDAHLFGISPREATHIDPQQRIMLELAWEALEDAGIPPHALEGSPTGVFLGAIWSDFALLLARLGLSAIAPHTVTGVHHSIIANRISYTLGLEGPSMAIDTACSASLVAVHQACESLRSGESTLALAGGVSLMLAPDGLMQMVQFGATSPRFRCRAFDASGDGYVRAEGAGMVVLKPLSSAIADGNPIHCVLLGSATNNDGRSNGLTAPSPRAQRSVLRAACAKAGIAPASVDYVEAHGTGTRLGDPIEASALGAVYGQGRAKQNPLRIGSVKTNIGHAAAAAGIAGLLKVALCLRHRELPASLHFESPNPEIDFEALGLSVQTELEPFPTHPERPARAGVSSFGFGGSNAHVVLEERRAPKTRSWLTEQGEAVSTRKPVFVLAGLGSQWLGMGRSLVEAEPSFRAAMLACEREIEPHTGFDLMRELFAEPDASRLEEPEVVQPLVFAMQVSLCALLRSYGVEPRALVGHSFGEIAAAHVAGALSLRDAARIVCLRGMLTKRLQGQGALLLVEQPREALAAERLGVEGVWMAVFNSPTATVLAGERHVLERVAMAQKEAGTRCAWVESPFPSHCPLVEPVLADLSAGLVGISPQPTHTPLISCVTGERIDGRALGPAYWARHLREPVRFVEALEGLLQEGEDLFLEVDPQPALARFVEEALRSAGRQGDVIPCLHRRAPEHEAWAEALQALRSRGVAIAKGLGSRDWPSLLPISAHTPEALAARVSGLLAWLAAEPQVDLEDVCFTAACGRSHLASRVAVVGKSKAELCEQLGLALGRASACSVSVTERPRVAFLFPGQGGQWEGMGRELLEREPAFRHAFLACDEALFPHLGWSVAERLDSPGHSHGDSSLIQPVLFAFQVALSRLWESFGVRPSAVVGHSMGEVAAAHIAGGLSLDDAAKVLCARSRHLQTLHVHGTMALVETSFEALQASIKRFAGRVSLAAYNSSKSFSLAGPREDLETLVAEQQAQGAFGRVMPLGFPFSHCQQVERITDALAKDLKGIVARDVALPLYSTATGEVIREPAFGVEYWIANVLQPVRFHQQVQALVRDGVQVLLEMSPHPLLAFACDQTLAEEGAQAVVLSSLRRGEGQRFLYETLAQLYTRGVDIDFREVMRRGGRIVPLPAYPFQHVHYWPEGLAQASQAEAHVETASEPEVPELLRLEQALRESARAPDTTLLLQILRLRASSILQVPTSMLPPDASLRRLGLDSIMAMQINNRLRALLQVELPVSLLLEDRPLSALASALAAYVREAKRPLIEAEALAASLEEGSL